MSNGEWVGRVEQPQPMPAPAVSLESRHGWHADLSPLHLEGETVDVIMSRG